MNRGMILIAAACFLYSCSSKQTSESETIATDSVTIANGQAIFSQDCSACHGFVQDGIGPQLGGVTSSVSADWIRNFIKDPKKIIESGDGRASTLYEKYKAIMPSFGHLSDDKINQLIAFIHTKKSPGPEVKLDPNALKNPIPEPIQMSDLVINLEQLTQIPRSSEEQPATRISKLDYQPNSDNLFVMDLRGKLYYLRDNKPEVYLDMAAERPNFIHKPGLATGFGSFAFHPEFEKNGLLYTTHTEPPATAKADFEYADSIKVTLQWVLTEWKTKDPKAFPYKGEGRELFRVNMESQIHGVQEVIFNPLSKPGDEDFGLLYIGVGDGGSAEHHYPFLCDSPEVIWGTVVRIDPKGRNSKNGKYGIPVGNPLVKSDNPKALKEIYARGFRNPHRITWSRKGDMLVANIGHHNIESLYIVKPGSNCGWPIREGTFLIDPSQNMFNIYPLPPDDSKNNFTYPVAEYDHDEGNAIAGGFEYWGKNIPELQGKFVFGDIVKGRLFYVEMNDLKLGSQATIKEWQVNFNGERKTLVQLSGASKVDERFGMDRHGELYLTTKPDGKIYRLVSAQKNAAQ
jgi:glucose/arabinose dehydrogenase/mono/diheme cytochrome c family protein